MIINTFVCRPYKVTDLESVLSLFYETVHAINIRDYSHEQINIWAPEVLDKARWAERLLEYFTFVVENNGKIIGFADLAKSGSLEHLYVDKDFQRCGVASLLLKTIEQKAHELGIGVITTESSITAKLFFEKHGFFIVQKREKIVRGMIFVIYDMKKNLNDFSE